MAPPVTIISDPLTPISGDRIVLVEGTIGNTVPVHRSDVKQGDVFYLTFAAEKGKSAREVAEILRDKYQLKVRHWVSPSEKRPDNSPTFDLYVDTDNSHHYLCQEVHGKFRFMPNLEHLTFKFGKKADYFMIGFRFDPADYEEVFGDHLRVAAESIDTIKFDILQYQNADDLLARSASEYAEAASESRLPEVMHLGGLAVQDRRDSSGKPVNTYFVVKSDSHHARIHDNYARAIADVRDERLHVSVKEREELYLLLTNPNDILEEEVKYLRERHQAGALDAVFFNGDNTAENAVGFETATNLLETNKLPFAEKLAEIPAAVYVVDGNHDRLKTSPPPTVAASHYQIPASVLRKIAADRYAGLITLGTTYVRSMEDDPRGTFPDRDLISRPKNFKVVWKGGEGDDPEAKTFTLVMVDTGGNDLYHPWMSEYFYEEYMQGVWASDIPFTHPPSIIEWIRHRSPDGEGVDPEGSSWMGEQDADIVCGHVPGLNHIIQRKFNPAESKISRAKPAGPDKDNHHGGQSHGRRSFFAGFHASSETKGYIGGHEHTLGNEYASARSSSGKLEYFELSFLGAMKQIVDDHKNNNDRTADGKSFDFEASLACLWKPTKECVTDPKVHPAVRTLYGKLIETHHDIKIHYQLGSAGAGKNPHFAVLAITPKGNIYQEIKYVTKKIIPHPDDPPGTRRYIVVYEISDEPMEDENEQLIRQWRGLKREDPERLIEMSPSRERIAKREKRNTSIAPSADSFKPYPKVKQVVEGDVSTSTDKLHNWLRFYAALAPGTYGGQLEVSFSQYVLDPKIRSYLLQGVVVGFINDVAGTHRWHLAWNFPNYLNLKLSKRWTIRGANPRLGLGVHAKKPTGGPNRHDADNLDAKFHRSIKAGEVIYSYDPLEFSAGYLYDFTGKNRGMFHLGVSINF